MSRKIKKNPSIVAESNAIARAKLVPDVSSVWEERIIALIVAKCRDNGNISSVIKINVEDLCGEKTLSTDQHRKIKKSVQELGRAAFEFIHGERGLTVVTIFSSLKIDDDGNLEAKINQDLSPHYFGLEREFAIRSLPEFRALNSIYSQVLYRYLNSWKNLPQGEAIIPLDTLHNTLSTPPSFRKNFKAFRVRVLEPAHAEITEKTNLYFEWEPVREGLRKVVAVRFAFRPGMISSGEKSQGGKGKKDVADDPTEHAKLQKTSNACFQKHVKAGMACKPKRSEKCRFCQERGRMMARNMSQKLAEGGTAE